MQTSLKNVELYVHRWICLIAYSVFLRTRCDKLLLLIHNKDDTKDFCIAYYFNLTFLIDTEHVMLRNTKADEISFQE
jgi:hypothetical protein